MTIRELSRAIHRRTGVSESDVSRVIEELDLDFAWDQEPTLFAVEDNRTGAVLSVDAMAVNLVKTLPPQLLIVAAGAARVNSDTVASLVSLDTSDPHDGIFRFLFVADPQRDARLGAPASVCAGAILARPLSDVRGVEILSASTSLVVLRGSLGSYLPAFDGERIDRIKGTLETRELNRCAVRGEDGMLYPLIGDLCGFTEGDAVRVTGIKSGITFCTQEDAVIIVWIGKDNTNG